MHNNPDRFRILIADDHTIFRDGLRRLLDSEPDMAVVGEAADGAEALSLVGAMKPDVLLLDLAMPELPGLEVLRKLSGSTVPVRTIVLTAAIEKPQIVQALQLGARGVVLKEAATQLLMKGIRTVMAGEYWIDHASVADLIDAIRSLTRHPHARESRTPFSLTPRELEIISGIVEGSSNKDLAEKFSISEQTVKHHLSNIFDKLGVSSRLELAVFALHHKVVDR